MAKSKYDVKIVNYGIYKGWDSGAKDLPKLSRVTLEVPARLQIEFGMVVRIRQAKGKSINWCIDHPGILNDDCKVRAPFTGHERVKSADWNFFLGDTIWEPVDDKIGDWHLWVELDGERIAEKIFQIVPEKWEHPV